jgi:hypothetical protein
MGIFGNKPKVADVHPALLFDQELSRIISAARARHVDLRTISNTLAKYADAIRKTAAVTWSPTKMYNSGNLKC